ncbi:hypothetical protein [Clostridium sp. Marseille-P2415]|uniref:hypothetical protein n=1 Tax=Clostridium sp. Marseille-P2415 TaxID=1805471 RepID=UPI0013565CB5
MFGLAAEVISVASAESIAAEQKNDDYKKTSIISASIATSTAASAESVVTAAAQNQDQKDYVESTSVVAIASASTVSCCQITHISSSN